MRILCKSIALAATLVLGSTAFAQTDGEGAKLSGFVTRSGSQLSRRIGPRVTRRISFSPAFRSDHWWMVKVARAASKWAAGNGRFSAMASTAAVKRAGLCARIDADGSIAVTCRSAGSYEPAPAPTLITVRASPKARLIKATMRGSGCRYLA